MKAINTILTRVHQSILIMIICMMVSWSAYGQQQVFVFETGEEITVERNDHPDDVRKASIYIGGFGPEGANSLGASFYQPGKYYFNATYGFSGYLVDGHLALSSWVSEGKIKLLLKRQGNDRYVAKTSIPKRRTFALHFGSGYFSEYKVNANSIVAGVTFSQATGANWKVEDWYTWKGFSLRNLNADIVYYFNKEKAYEFNTTIEEESRDIGARLYFEGRTSFIGKKARTTIHYMIGLSVPLMKFNKVSVPAGLGIGYNFG